MKLELKKRLIPYLSHGLQIKILNYKCDYVGIEYATANGFYVMADEFYVTYDGGSTGKSLDDFKPLLLPLSLATSIDYGYKTFAYFENQVLSGECSAIVRDALIKHHFDVFRLIDAGCALNKNDYGNRPESI